MTSRGVQVNSGLKAASLSVVLEREELAAAIADLGIGTLLSIVELDGGTGHSFRIDRVNGRPMVLKAFSDTSSSSMERETYASHLLQNVGIPFTRFLVTDETRSRLPFPFTVSTYLPGERVTLFSGQPDVPDLYRQMGSLLRRLHTVVLPAYGYFGKGGIVECKATNAAWVASLFRNSLDRFRRYGGDDSIAERVSEIVAANAEVIAFSRGAVFAHDDLQPNNVLAMRDLDGQLRLTGLIDFGNAHASDAVCDLAKCLFCSEHDAPGSAASILEGYGPIDHPNIDAALWIYLLLHRLTMWSWLRQIGVIKPGERHGLIIELETMVSGPR